MSHPHQRRARRSCYRRGAVAQAATRAIGLLLALLLRAWLQEFPDVACFFSLPGDLFLNGFHVVLLALEMVCYLLEVLMLLVNPCPTSSSSSLL